MTAEQYVNQVTKNIKCSKKRKQDIAKQLLAEMKERTAQGEHLENILSEMGRAEEVAESFNESISPEENNKYRKRKSMIIASSVIAFIFLLGFAAYWMLPKAKDLSSSEYFTRQEVEDELIRIIDLLDNNDYEPLQKSAIPKLASVLQPDTIQNAKLQVNNDFGERINIGTIYSQEVIQNGQVYAVCQVTVSYSNTAVTYTITFDKNMKLCGLYMK